MAAGYERASERERERRERERERASSERLPRHERERESERGAGGEEAAWRREALKRPRVTSKRSLRGYE